MHRDAVLSVPPGGVRVIGSSPDCAIQGMYEPKRILSIQAHPEFDGFIMRNILNTRHEQGIFDEAFWCEATSRAEKHQDGVKVAVAMWDFILGY